MSATPPSEGISCGAAAGCAPASLFACALGRRAKTDPIEAAVLATFGRAAAPPATTPPSATEQHLGALILRRRQLVALVTAESNRSAH